MGFQDNSGDILLDVTLTDSGRERLARGDGSFNIEKFALGDDEIDYGLIDTTQVNTALRDLQVLKTPIMEASANAKVGIRHFLTSILRTNLLFYPELIQNVKRDKAGPTRSTSEALGKGMYIVLVGKDTENAVFNSTTGENFLYGVQKGHSVTTSEPFIMIEQGINNSSLGKDSLVGGDLIENQYIISINDTLGSILSGQPGADVRQVQPNFVNSSRIATYNITSLQGGGSFVRNMKTVDINNDRDVTEDNKTTQIVGLRGTELRFRIRPSRNLRTSFYLFERFGNKTLTYNAKTFKYIDTTVRVVGGNTGATIELPVRFLRLSS